MSAVSFLPPGRCKKRRPKPLPSLPGVPQPGPHPGVCRVVEGHMGTSLKGCSRRPTERRVRAVPDVRAPARHGGATVPDGVGARKRRRRKERGRKGHPPPKAPAARGIRTALQARAHPPDTCRWALPGTYACPGTQGCDLCTPTWPTGGTSPCSPHACTHVCAHTHTYTHTEGTALALPLHHGLTARNCGAGGEKVSHASASGAERQIAFDEPKRSQFPLSGKAEGGLAIP